MICTLILTLMLLRLVTASMNPVYWDPKIVKIADSMVTAINLERSFQNNSLFPIDFDYSFQSDLQNYVRPGPGLQVDLGQNSSLHTNGDYTVYYLGFFLMKLPEFVNEAEYGYKYLFRHLIPIKHSLKYTLPKILENQRKCYDINICSKTSFNNFETCIKKSYSVKQECKGAHLIYARIFKFSFSRIAFVDSFGYRYYYGRYAYDFDQGVDYPYLTV